MGRITAGAAALGLALGVLLLAPEGAAAAAGGATVSITPGPVHGGYTDQQVVRVAVAPNSIFTPNSRVVVIECADPGGSVTNLPTSLTSCDNNTIEPDTVVVHADGSFVVPSYPLYALPSAVLGEQANWQPVCNAAHPCVLFAGEDQNDFSKAKAFSAAFTMSAAPASAAAGGAPATATPTTTPPQVSAAVSLAATQLAFTGAPGGLGELGAVGAALLLLGWATAVLVRRGVG